MKLSVTYCLLYGKVMQNIMSSKLLLFLKKYVINHTTCIKRNCFILIKIVLINYFTK